MNAKTEDDWQTFSEGDDIVSSAPTSVLAAFALFGPGLVTYIVTTVVMVWPWPTTLFPFMAARAVPMAVAREVTGWWWLVVAIALIAAVIWEEAETERARAAASQLLAWWRDHRHRSFGTLHQSQARPVLSRHAFSHLRET